MALWRKKPQKTERIDGDFGRAEIHVTEQAGETPVINIDLALTAEYAAGITFQSNRTKLGLDHPETLHSLHVYAVTIGDLPGRRDDAVELLDWLVDARADDLENQLLALNDLTRLLYEGGELAVAERRLRQALSGWERLRGQDDAETLHIASNLANVLLSLGRQDEAEGLMRDTVARRTRTLGASHPDTLSSRNTLAGALRGTPARLAEAEQLYRAILIDAEAGGHEAGGESGEVSLAAQHNLAAVYAHQGKYAEALTMYEQLIDARTRFLGADHADTWSARNNRAVVLNLLGRAREAEAELDEVLQGYRRTYGARHPATLDVQVDLAMLKINRGQHAAAVPLIREALDGYRTTHGTDHPVVRELNDLLRQLNR